MDAILRIQIRIAARAAQQELKQLASGLASVSKAVGAANGAQGRSAGALTAEQKKVRQILSDVTKGLDRLNGKHSFLDTRDDAAKLASKSKQVNTMLADVRKGMDRLDGKRTFLDMKDDASKLNVQLQQISQGINQMKNPSYKIPGPSSKVTGAGADKQRLAYQKALQAAEAQAAEMHGGRMAAIKSKSIAMMRGLFSRQLSEEKVSYKASENAQREHLSLMERMSMRVNGQLAVSKRGMIAFGKDLQWVGRQLNFNFTLPLLTAATMAGRWALENERAMTRVTKVYGDGSRDYTAELGKVENAMTSLSNIYGIEKSQVLDLAGAWAAAGATGAELVRSVETNLRLGILGDYTDLNAAFEDLITIQGAFQLTTKQTSFVIAELNTVENMTAAQMQDLTRGIALAGGAARVSGISIEELAAQIALLVPVTGSSSNAGNALKTIYANMLDPTRDMLDLFQSIGIEFQSQDFQGKDVAARLQIIADKYGTLSDAQKGYIGATFGGRRQINRFIVLMEGLANKSSQYYEVMKALDPGNADKNWARANKEIQTLLDSDPRRLEIVTTQLKNMLAEAVVPMIPMLISLLVMVKRLFDWFNQLSPEIQQFAVYSMAAVAAIGVLAQALGSAQLLLGTFLRPLVWIGLQFEKIIPIIMTAGKAVGVFLLSPWGIALAAAGVLAYIFRDEIQDALGGAVEYVLKGFNMLPKGIQDAFKRVVDVISRAVGLAKDLLSWLNPFARHSPSLVENVTAGVAVIISEYSKLGRMSSVFQGSIAALKAFGAATADVVRKSKRDDRSQQRSEILSVAPDAGPALETLYGSLDGLQAQMDGMTGAMDRQAEVVANADAAYQAASSAVDRFDASLIGPRANVARLESEISKANDAIGVLADTPLIGMRAMGDQIFENEMAQKRLRLEMLRINEAADGYASVEDKIAAINGDLEMLRGKAAGLQEAGAGNDILGVYNDQLAALEQQKNGLGEAAKASDDLSKQLDNLGRASEILNLEQSLNFDPLLRQIDQLTTSSKEMSFDDIVAGIKEQQAVVDTLTPAYERQRSELERQEVVLDNMTTARDVLKAAYDRENDTLSVMKSKYGELDDQIGKINDALGLMTDAYTAAQNAKSEFDAMGAGNFDEAGLPVFGSDLSLDQMVADLQAQAEGMFDGIDPFAKIKEKWDLFVSWWDANVVPTATQLWNDLKGGLEQPINWAKTMDSGGLMDAAKSMGGQASGLADKASELINKTPLFEKDVDISGSLKELVNFVIQDFGPDFKNVGDAISSASTDIWEGLTAIGRAVHPLWVLLGRLMTISAAVTYVLLDFASSLIVPGIEVFGKILGGVLETIGGLLGFVASVLTGDFGQAWESFKDIFQGMSKIIEGVALAIGYVLEALAKSVWNIAGKIGDYLAERIRAGVRKISEWLVEGIKWVARPFEWLYDHLVGHSVIPDMVDAIVGFFLGLPGRILDALVNLVSWVGGKFIELATAVWNTVYGAGEDVVNFFIGLPQRMLDALVNMVGWIGGKFVELGTSIWTPVHDKGEDVVNFFIALPQRVLDAIGNVATWLWDKGKGLVGGLLGGIRGAAVEVWNWFRDVPITILQKIGGVERKLFSKGLDFIQGLWDGTVERFDEVIGWFGSLGTKIAEGIGDVAGTLKSLGSDLMGGFVDGMKSAWDTFADWWNRTIGSWSVDVPGFHFEIPDMPTFSGTVVNEHPNTGHGTGGAGRNTGGDTGGFAGRSFGGTNAATLNSGGNTININGNLEFPNINDPDDVKTFLDNLEALAA